MAHFTIYNAYIFPHWFSEAALQILAFYLIASLWHVAFRPGETPGENMQNSIANESWC